MYCSNCGKFIDYKAKLCKECEAALNSAQVPPYADVPPYTPPNADTSGQGAYSDQQGYYPPTVDPYFYCTEPEPYNRMFGFGKALASTIMGVIGFVFVYIALIAASFGAGFLMTAVSLGVSIPALVFGIQSIKCFVRRKATCAKNIPTLVLGIYGVMQAGYALAGTSMALLILLANF